MEKSQVKTFFNVNKIEQFYKINTPQMQFVGSQGFKDAAGIALSRNNEYIDPTMFSLEYPELIIPSVGFLADNSGGFADTVRSLRSRAIGSYREAGSKANNIGNITMSADTSIIRVHSYSADSEWSEFEMRKAASQGRSLQSEYFDGHKQIYAETIEDLSWNGTDGASGVFYSYGAHVAAGGTYATGTGVDRFNYISDFIDQQRSLTNNIRGYYANVCVLPTAVYNNAVRELIDGANGSNITVMGMLQKAYPEISFKTSVRCDDIGGLQAMALFSTNPQAAKLRIPMPLEFSAIEKRLFNYEVASQFSFAGVDVLESRSGMIVVGL